MYGTDGAHGSEYNKARPEMEGQLPDAANSVSICLTTHPTLSPSLLSPSSIFLLPTVDGGGDEGSNTTLTANHETPTK